MGDMQTANSCLCANLEHLTFFKKISVNFPVMLAVQMVKCPTNQHFKKPHPPANIQNIFSCIKPFIKRDANLWRSKIWRLSPLYYTSPQNVSPKIMIWEWIRTLYRKSYMKCIASKQEYMNKVPVVLSTYEIYQDFERLDQYLHQKEFLVLITRFCKISGRVRCVLKAEAQTKLQ